MSETCKQCSEGSCPFAYTLESEYAQGMGCLPSPGEILNMRVTHNLTWACHSNLDKPCLGALNRLKELGFDHKVVNPKLLTLEDHWMEFQPTEEFYRECSRRDMVNLLETHGTKDRLE